MKLNLGGSGGSWAKAGVHIQTGDVITITGECTTSKSQYQDKNGEYKTNHNFPVQTVRNGVMNLTIKEKALRVIALQLGDDTSAWIGKKLKATVTALVTGKSTIDYEVVA